MSEHNFDFDTEFMSDAEVDEMLDAVVTAVSEKAVEEDSKTAIVNPYNVQKVLYTYKVMKYLTRGKKAKVSYKLHAPYKSMGFVSVVGADLSFGNAEWFMKAVELASNFDVYPKTDGTVQMDFTFHGLTKSIE